LHGDLESDGSGTLAIRNPHGVGDSGEWMTDCKTHCECCQMLFLFTGHPRMRERWPSCCPRCGDHILDGSEQERIVALTEHASRARKLADLAYETARQAKADFERVDERNRRLSSHLHDVIEERDKLRRQVDVMRELHPHAEGAKCQCGRVPCPEREALYGYDPFLGKRPA
jgi:hypothetical protein